MKTTDIEYSIILPCLNEEKTLGICIRKIHQFFSNTGLTYEIIVADNGSTDNSALVAKNNRADVIQVSQKGYGSALRHGIEHCNGKYIIMGDADDSYNFLELSLFIERLQAGYDMVMGNRFELVALASIHQMRICEIPVILYPDGRKRRPHLRSWRDGFRHMVLLYSLYLLRN